MGVSKPETMTTEEAIEPHPFVPEHSGSKWCKTCPNVEAHSVHVVQSPQVTSFDVTCVIGTVELSPDGTEPPHVAAMRLIAEHDTPGTFTFPFPTGGMVRVTVEYPEGWRN